MPWSPSVILQLETSKVGQKFIHYTFCQSLFVCSRFNTPGRAITANKYSVCNVDWFFYNKKQYLGVSGDGGFFEVFDVSELKEEEFLSKYI